MTTTTVPEKQVDFKAAAWSIGIHVLLLAILSYIVFTKYFPETLVVEPGMEVNLGTSDDGSGNDQPMDVEDPAPEVATAPNSSGQQSASTIMTSDDDDAPTVNNPNDAKNPNRNNNPATTTTRNNPTNNNNNARPQQQQAKYLMPNATGRGGNSANENRPGTSEGNTTGPGDRGVPGGTPGASNYIGHNLNGRDISPKSFSAEFREGGTVVIRVTVNKEGQIVSKMVVSAPSAELRRIALQKLSEAKFSKSPNGTPEQIGNVTIKFKAR